MHEKEFTFQIFEISHIFTHPAFHEEVTNIHYTRDFHSDYQYKLGFSNVCRVYTSIQQQMDFFKVCVLTQKLQYSACICHYNDTMPMKPVDTLNIKWFRLLQVEA